MEEKKKVTGDTLLTIAEAAAYLGVSRPTLYNRMKERRDILPANHNPELRRQRRLVWYARDIDQLRLENLQKNAPAA